MVQVEKDIYDDRSGRKREQLIFGDETSEKVIVHECSGPSSQKYKVKLQPLQNWNKNCTH